VQAGAFETERCLWQLRQIACRGSVQIARRPTGLRLGAAGEQGPSNIHFLGGRHVSLVGAIGALQASSRPLSDRYQLIRALVSCQAARLAAARMALPIPSCGLLLLLAVIAGHAREAAGVAGQTDGLAQMGLCHRLPPPATACRTGRSSSSLTASPAAAAETNCYQFGSGGWDLIYWGDPGVRLPPGGAIPICNSGFGSVLFRWRHPAGVFLIPSDQCPGAFEAPFNETYTELAPVSAKGEFNWVPPRQPAGVSYWLTSQVPGNCEAGGSLHPSVHTCIHARGGLKLVK
jgi:hypothetical protein